MREILFRGKKIHTTEWIYGDLRKRNYERQYFIVSKEEKDERSIILEQVAPDTIGQYAGFKDIKGRKIFEHDIVRIHYNDRPYSDEDDICLVEYQLDKYIYEKRSQAVLHVSYVQTIYKKYTLIVYFYNI